VNQLQQERDGITPVGKALSPKQQKIQELEARIDGLERGKSILKKQPRSGWPMNTSVRVDRSTAG
jgi:transposase